MIKGHGDDAYQYEGIHIVSDFSSNICRPQGHTALAQHLAELLTSRPPSLLASYPEPEAWSLERIIAERHGINPACVIVTAGVTDAIYLIARAFRYRPLIPQPTFSEYADATALLPPADSQHYCYWLCCPNNPTGSVAKPEQIERLAVRYDLVVVDQSYEHYTRCPVMTPRHAMPLMRVVQLHSMTKTFGVPGLRLGYITAPMPLADVLRRHLRPWAVSSIAIEAGKYLEAHHDELRCRPDLDEAQRLCAALSAVEGIEVQPTSTSFMLCRLKNSQNDMADDINSASLKQYLLQQHGMLIRDASNFAGLTPQHFRVASQSPAENDALVVAVKQFLTDKKKGSPL
jgi:threonine-phosphate decarboxylase